VGHLWNEIAEELETAGEIVEGGAAIRDVVTVRGFLKEGVAQGSWIRHDARFDCIAWDVFAPDTRKLTEADISRLHQLSVGGRVG
jgi:hypothetical protein